MARSHGRQLASCAGNSIMNGIGERRKNTRHALHCRVSFFGKSSYAIAEGVTRDLSSAGFYCVSPMPLTVGESLTCVLRMPSPYPSRNHALLLECRVRVVRLENVSDEQAFGIGCQLEGYRHYSLDEVGSRSALHELKFPNSDETFPKRGLNAIRA